MSRISFSGVVPRPLKQTEQQPKQVFWLSEDCLSPTKSGEFRKSPKNYFDYYIVFLKRLVASLLRFLAMQEMKREVFKNYEKKMC